MSYDNPEKSIALISTRPLKKDHETIGPKNNYKFTSHKYYKYKSKFFKTKKLNFWDRNAPYPKTIERKISWMEAKDIVLDSYYDFDKQAGDIAKMFFDKKWKKLN